jgi:hypothetical protein
MIDVAADKRADATKQLESISAMLGSPGSSCAKKEVSVSVVTASGKTFSLGEVGWSQNIGSVKALLAVTTGMSVGSQQLFMIDDNREGIDDLELKNSELVKLVLAYTSVTTELQLAVMHRGGQTCAFSSLPSRQVRFPHAFDTSGALYFIGTAGGTQEYENPHESRKVVCAMSTCLERCASMPSRFIMHSNPGNVYNVTKNQPMQWMSVDLGVGRALVPNHYCLRYGNNAGSHQPCLRSWVLGGSHDGINWATLREHDLDTTLPAEELSVANWAIENVNEAYRHFRILQTGPNAACDQYLACAGIELYGELLGDPEAGSGAPRSGENRNGSSGGCTLLTGDGRQ